MACTMQTEISTLENGNVRVSYEFAPGASMMESERSLQAASNDAVAAGTGECLSRFDTDGTPIIIGGKKLTSKGRKAKIYQSPGGPVSVERHVYQTSGGGRTFCPMEHAARAVRTATPLFARQVSSKYANTDSGAATSDLAEHGREVARTYVREIASDVALIASEKEDVWEFAVAQAPAGKRVKTVSVGTDGTCMLMCKDEGWREVMVGTIALYDDDGGRLHTTYIAAPPEYGKETFYTKMDRELAVVKNVYPDVRYAGVADGAACNWPWIEQNTTWHILDFWHVTEYLHAASAAMGAAEAAQQRWAEKPERGGVGALLDEMVAQQEGGVRGKTKRESLDKAITYFDNNQDKMDYPT
jgi:hypothetical protein